MNEYINWMYNFSWSDWIIFDSVEIKFKILFVTKNPLKLQAIFYSFLRKKCCLRRNSDVILVLADLQWAIINAEIKAHVLWENKRTKLTTVNL